MCYNIRMEDIKPALNTHKELYREPDLVNGSFYSPSVFVTQTGSIGMDVGGLVFVMTIRQWHHLASRNVVSVKENAGNPGSVSGFNKKPL